MGFEPLAYLRDVLTRLPAMTNRDDLRALKPPRWRPALIGCPLFQPSSSLAGSPRDDNYHLPAVGRG